MGRLLLLVTLVAIGWFVFRRLGRPPANVGGGPGRPAGGQQPPAQAHVSLCAECGVHAPDNTGIRYQNLFFCSPEHLNAWLARQGKP